MGEFVKRKSRSFMGHAATYAVGNVARRLVGFVMLPIYTRFLTPADYGVIGLMMFALALFEPLFGARLGVAIPKFYFEEDDRRAKRAVIWGAIGLTGVVSAAGMVLLILLRGMGSEIIFGDRRYALALGIFAINLLSRPLEDTGMLYLRMHEQSRLFFGISMAKLMVQLGLNILLVVYWRQGVVGVVLSGVISSFALGAALTVYIGAREAPGWDWNITRKMLRFCWPLWLSALAGLYVGSAGGMYLRIFGTLSDVGKLELALRFAAVIGMLIWTPFGQQWGPLSYRYFKEPDGARKFQVAFIGIGTAMFVGGLGVSIFAGPAIRIMATKPFYVAASVVPVLTLGFIINYLQGFFTFAFLATNHTKMSSVCQYLTAAVITVAYFALVPRYGLMGAASAQCIAFVASFFYTWALSRQYYDPGFHLGTIGVFALISGLAYLCANVLLPAEAMRVDLLAKSVIWALAGGSIMVLGVRKMQQIDASLSAKLPWPFDQLGRLPIWRGS